jgi:hypothetical protein
LDKKFKGKIRYPDYKLRFEIDELERLGRKNEWSGFFVSGSRFPGSGYGKGFS